MNERTFAVTLCVCVMLSASMACAVAPTTPSGAVTVTVPGPASPANGAQIANVAQPVTLTINNAVVVGDSAVTYTFEVASDAGFGTVVLTKSAGENAGQTSVKLDVLPAGKDYYWHARTAAGGTVGTFSSPLKFTIGPAIIVSAPAPVSPAAGATTTAWPVLSVGNAARSGPVTALTYRFELATNQAFSPTLATASVSEGSSQTSFTPTVTLPTQKTQYFWRATATDSTSGISSQPSAVQTFTLDPVPLTAAGKLAAERGVVLWPGAQPTGSAGHVNLGDNWQVQSVVSFGGKTFISPPLEALRLFDLMDRGLSPQGAIDFMIANGYPNAGAYYPVAGGVIGIDFMYLGYDQSRNAWDLILRGEGQ
jgi:hypothetical protein